MATLYDQLVTNLQREIRKASSAGGDGGTANFKAKAGGTIKGRLARGNNGKFTAAGSASAQPNAQAGRAALSEAARNKDKKGKGGKGKKGAGGKGSAKPKAVKQTPQQKAQAQAATEQKNTAAVRAALKTGPNDASMAAMTALKSGKPADPEQLEALSGETGLVERGASGAYHLSPEGEKFLSAAAKGDVGGASDALSRGQDKLATEDARSEKQQAAKDKADARTTATAQHKQEVASKQQAREQAAAQKAKAGPSSGKGASGSSSKGSSSKSGGDKPTTDATASKNRDAVSSKLAGKGAPSEAGSAALDALAGGDDADPAALKELVASGLASVDARGQASMTPEGKAYRQAASKGDAGSAREALNRAAVKSTPKASAPARDGGPVGRAMADRAQQETRKAFGDTPDWSSFLTISKRDDVQRIVEGFASSENVDGQPGIWKGQAYQGDSVASDAIDNALPGFMKWGNLREMHQPSAVGVVVHAEIIKGVVTLDDGTELINPLHIRARIVDDTAWRKVQEGVYKGFSIGGRTLAAAIEKIGGALVRRITALVLNEISLVDRPANPTAQITLFKGDGMTPEELEAAALEKAASDPKKIVALIQQLRNQAELDGDEDTAANCSEAIRLLMGGAPAGSDEDEETDTDSTEDGTTDGDPAGGDDTTKDAGGDDDVVAMAQTIGDLAKSGRTFSGANMAHVQAAHDAIAKMAGMSCAPKEEGAAAGAAPTPGAVAKVEGGERPDTDIDALTKALAPMFADVQKRLDEANAKADAQAAEIAQLKKAAAPGGPVVRQAEKQIGAGGDQPAGPTIAEQISGLQKMQSESTDVLQKGQIGDEITRLKIKEALGYK